MAPKVRVRPLARLDMLDCAEYILEDSPDSAERFLDAAEAAFDLLAATPYAGAPHHFERWDLQGVRIWPLNGFPKHNIIYRPTSDGVEIIRILHVARHQVDELLDE